MKKLIALTVCAMLLLSGCSAVTADDLGLGLQLQDYTFTDSDGQTLDLTGLTIGTETAAMDESAGLHLTISNGSEDASFTAALVEGQYLSFTLQSAGGTSVYAVDTFKLMQSLAQEMNDPFSPAAPGEEDDYEMTDEELERMMAEMEAGDEAYSDFWDDDGDSLETEDLQGDIRNEQARLDRASEILEQCGSEGEKEIDGITYHTIDVHIPKEEMTELLNAEDLLSVGDIYFPLGDVLAAGGLTFTLDGTLAYSEDGARYLITLSPSVTTREEDVYTLDICVDMTSGDESASISCSATENGTESLGGLSFALVPYMVDSADWLPMEIGADTVVVDSFNSPEVSQAIAESFTVFLDDIEVIVDGVTSTP